MAYKAPVDDMQFALKAMAGLDRLEGDGFADFEMDLVQPILG